MTDRSNTRRRLLTVVAVLSLLASACGLDRGAGGDVAATVNFFDGGTVEISTDQLDDFYDTIVDDSDFVAGAYGGDGVPPGLRASMLSDMVIGAVVDDLLDQRDLEVSAENQAEGTRSIEEIVASLFPNEADPIAMAQARFESLPYLPFLADLQAKQFQLGDALSEASGGGQTVEVPCSSHILLETEVAADDVIAQLDEGADFATLASELSTDPSAATNGGDLGCSDPSRFVPEFAAAITDAPLDTIIGPVQTQFGFHVITVTDVQEQTVGAPDPQQLVGTELLSAISQVSVDVAPSIGTWDEGRGQVVPQS